MKIGDKAKVSPKLTGEPDWVEGYCNCYQGQSGKNFLRRGEMTAARGGWIVDVAYRRFWRG